MIIFLSGCSRDLIDVANENRLIQYPNGKKQIAPAIDHDHETGLIRGILSERVNQLTDQWHKWKAYGKLSEPKELIEYRKHPPAFECIGKVYFK